MSSPKLIEAFGNDLKNYKKHQPVLPKPVEIYDKRFHFMDESIRERENRRKNK